MAEFESCDKCRYSSKSDNEYPCNKCVHSATDKFKPKTNADKIRSMNDKELAEFLEQIVSGNRNVIGINCGNSKCESWKCTECISMWLQSEAE